MTKHNTFIMHFTEQSLSWWNLGIGLGTMLVWSHIVNLTFLCLWKLHYIPVKRKAQAKWLWGSFWKPGSWEWALSTCWTIYALSLYKYPLKNRSCSSYKYPLMLAQHNSIYRHVLRTFLTALQGVKRCIARTEVATLCKFKSYHANQLKYQNAGEHLQLDVVSRASASLKLCVTFASCTSPCEHCTCYSNNSQLHKCIKVC